MLDILKAVHFRSAEFLIKQRILNSVAMNILTVLDTLKEPE